MSPTSINDIIQAIKEKGYWSLIHPDLGKRADRTLKPRIDLQTIEALELCKMSAFDLEHSKDIIENIIAEPVAVFYRGFGQTKNVHCFRPYNPDSKTPEPSMLVLGLCSSNFRINLYKGSHLRQLGAPSAGNGVPAISKEQVDELSSPEEVILQQGGYIVFDGRLPWKVLQGKAAFLGVVGGKEAKDWFWMPIPKTEGHVKIMGEMENQNSTFCRNFRWLDSTVTHQT